MTLLSRHAVQGLMAMIAALGLLPALAAGNPSDPGGSGLGRHISVQDFGAKGDGHADDTDAINACISAAAASGVEIVDFSPGTYRLRRRPGGGQKPALLLRNGVSLDGHGCTLLLDDNCSYIGTAPAMTARAYLDADASAGADRVHVDSTAPFEPGDPIGIRLGNNEWDSHETREMFFTSVSRVVGPHTLMLSDGLPLGLEISKTTSLNRAVLRFRPEENPVYSNGFVRDFILQRTARGNPESGIELFCAHDVNIENISATDPGAGVVLLAYCRRVLVRGVSCGQSVALGGHPAKGRVINVWNSTDCIFDDFEGHAFAGPFAFFESYCHNMRCTNWRIVNDWTRRMGGPRPFNRLLMVVQRSEAVFEDLHISGDVTGQVVVDTGGTPAKVEIHGITIAASGKLKSFDVGQVSSGKITLVGQDYGPLKRTTITGELRPDQKGPMMLKLGKTGLWHRVLISAEGMKSEHQIRIDRTLVKLNPGNPSVEIPSLGHIGTDYQFNRPASEMLMIDAPLLKEKLRIAVTIDYFQEVTSK